jgi:hypothetical protein
MPRTELQELMSKLDLDAKFDNKEMYKIGGRFEDDGNGYKRDSEGRRIWLPATYNTKTRKWENDHTTPQPGEGGFAPGEEIVVENQDRIDYLNQRDENNANGHRTQHRGMHFRREKAYIPNSSPKIKDWNGSYIPEFKRVILKTNGEIDWDSMQAYPDQLVLICRQLIAKQTHNKKKYKALLSLLLTHGMHHQTGHHTHHGPHHHNRNQNRGPRPPRPYRASAPNTTPAAAGSQP